MVEQCVARECASPRAQYKTADAKLDWSTHRLTLWLRLLPNCCFLKHKI